MKKAELCDPEDKFSSSLDHPLQRMERREGARNIAICLTLYNEPADLLQTSLESIIRSLDKLGRKGSGYRQTTITIIADGNAHPA